jgi:hypothetical protein
MKKAKSGAGVLLALLLFGGLAIAALPGFAYAQTVIVDDSTPVSPDAAGDPDMPGEKPPAHGGPVSWNSVGSGLYAGDSSGLRSRPETSTLQTPAARLSWRLWFANLVRAVRMGLGR